MHRLIEKTKRKMDSLLLVQGSCPLTDAHFGQFLFSFQYYSSTCSHLGLVSVDSLPFLFFPCPILSLISFGVHFCVSLTTLGRLLMERRARQEGRGPYVAGECPQRRQRPLHTLPLSPASCFLGPPVKGTGLRNVRRLCSSP